MARAPLATLTAILAVTLPALAGCGEKQAEGVISNIDKARNARALTSLQQAMVFEQTVAAQGGAADATTLVGQLQAADPSNRYTTQPPTDVGVVQVIGGGSRPVMFVGINSPPDSPRQPYYLAIWSGGGTSSYYLGHEQPGYTADAPAGPGWSTEPPNLASSSP